MSYSELVIFHIRLTILRELMRTNGYRSNESVLYDVISQYGLGCGRDCVRTQISWLADQGLVTLGDAGVLIPELTQRGLDVASGAVTVPGVKRPSPGK